MSEWTTERIAALLRELDDIAPLELGILDRPIAEIERAGSLFRPGATEEAIAATERRLGVRLPPSYRVFLALSNGAWWDGQVAEVAYDNPTELLPVEQLRTTLEATPITVQVWTEELMDAFPVDLDEVSEPTPGNPVDVLDHMPYRHGIVISTPEREHLALVPRADREEWELWSRALEGGYAYVSFGDWLECSIAGIRRRLAYEIDRDDLVARARPSGHYALIEILAKTGDPRAVELTREGLLRGTNAWSGNDRYWRARFARLLAEIGDKTDLPLIMEQRGHVEPEVQSMIDDALARLRERFRDAS